MEGHETEPLAARMRPTTLEEVVGQDHILGEGKLLRRVIEADRLTNIILYGPPGCGKTTLAEVVAKTTKRNFVRLSGVLSGVADIRKICERARNELGGQGTILFIDEIHRFNKSQQDVLLPYVEDGTVVLIGATTHNPNFFINTPLTSRSLVFELHALEPAAIARLLERALADKEKGYGATPSKLDDDARDFLAEICDGDARHALTALEIAMRSTPKGDDGAVHLTLEVIQECVQRRQVRYDKKEDGHYDTISAFIKSIRGSDPDAAVYWLGKMLTAGEDPRFIARRLVISASEDIGNADPYALQMAVACSQACEQIGLPEAQLVLAQTTIYLALAPKSNSATMAIGAARDDVRNGRTIPVPRHLRDGHYSCAKKMGNAIGYKYAHNSPDGIAQQDYLGVDREYYIPTDRGYEKQMAARLEFIKKKLKGEE